MIIIIAAVFVYVTMFSVVPSNSGTVYLEGLTADLSITWDEYQIPHIHGSNEIDIYLVMGYLHARDRLWQMTKQQYKLEGLHSREIDPELLALDRFYITLGFGSIAKQAFSDLGQQERILLEAYASGINQFMSKNKTRLPVEFSLSDTNPIKWEPWHAIGIQLLWAWEHQHSFWTKPAFGRIHSLNNPSLGSVLSGMDAPHSDLFGTDNPVISNRCYEKIIMDFLLFTKMARPVQTRPTGTGMIISQMMQEPLRALLITRESPLSLPDEGYEMVIHSGDMTRSGVTIPGFPVFITGQNNHMAWSLQPLPVDDGDFFTGMIFKEPASGPVNWGTDAGISSKLSNEISLARHILDLKNGKEHLFVSKTSHGMPIVSVAETENCYLAFDWVGFRPPTDIGAYMKLSSSESVEGFLDIAESITMPAVQILFSTARGSYGRIAAGYSFSNSQPLRIRSHEEKSDVSSLGRHIKTDIHQDGPPVFFLEQPVSERENVRVRSVFSPPWNRSERFLELLDEASLDAFSEMLINEWHKDTYSGFAASIVPILTDVLSPSSEDPVLKHILPYLHNWNFEFRSNETAATVFQMFMFISAEYLYAAWLDDTERSLLFTAPQVPLNAVSRMIKNPDKWPLSHPMSYEEWVFGSMATTLEMLESRFGKQPHDWQWGRVLQADFSPPLFDHTLRRNRSARLAAKHIYSPGVFSIAGSGQTIQAAHHSIASPFKASGATTSKHIIIQQPGPLTCSVLSTGQSGNLFSDHYKDQFLLWKHRRLRPGKHPFIISPDDFQQIQQFKPE